jgi:histone H3/H4
VDVNDTTVILAPELRSSPVPDADITGVEEVPDFASDDEPAEVDFGEVADEADAADNVKAARGKSRKRKGVRLSRYGIPYPSLPPAVVKRLANSFAQSSGVKGKVSADTLAALTQASDWFLEQVSDDLAAYAKHAARKTIDESDMLTLMRR